MAGYLKNKSVLSGLPTVQNSSYSFAFLIPETSSGVVSPSKDKNKVNTPLPVFQFIYNPEQISISFGISYTQGSIPYTNIQPITFEAGGNRELSIQNIYLDSREERKSLKPILDKLLSLRTPTTLNGLINQPVRVYFKWGSQRSPLCVVTSVSWTETSWIDGFPVRASLNLTLLEVKEAVGSFQEKIVKDTIDKAIKNSQLNRNLPKALSEKQVIDGRKVVRDYVNRNKTLLPKSAQLTLNDPNSEIRINRETGQVDIYGTLGNFIYTLGMYNGQKFSPARLQ